MTQVFVFCFSISRLIHSMFVYVRRQDLLRLQIFLLLITIFNPIILGQVFYYNDVFFTSAFVYLLAHLLNNHNSKRWTSLFLLLLVTGLRLNSPVLMFIVPIILYCLPNLFDRRKIPYLSGLYIILFISLNFTLKNILIKKPGSYSSNIPLYELSLIYAEHPAYRSKLQWLENYIDLDKTTSNIKANHTIFFGNVFFAHNENENDYYHKEKAILETEAIFKNYLRFFIDHPFEILKTKLQLYLAQLVVYEPNDTEPYFMNNHSYAKKAHLNNIYIPIMESDFFLSVSLKKIYRYLTQIILHSELRFIFISPVLFFLAAILMLFMKRISQEMFTLLGILPLLYHMSFFLAPYGYSNKYLLPLYIPLSLLVLINCILQHNNPSHRENIRE